jgi:diguanylate cyclase (GGDEF)-like protein
MRLFRRLASLRITVKFSLAFGLLLAILLLETIIALKSLTVVIEANKAILVDTEIQRLAMSMSRNWESVKRLRSNYFFQSPSIGVDQAYEVYAINAGGKITEVVRDGAKLKRLITTSESSKDLGSLEQHLNKYLSTVSQYASTFEESTALESRLLSDNTGLQSLLDQKADDIYKILGTLDQPAAIYAAYYEMRFHEKDYLTSLQVGATDEALDTTASLRRSIENHPMVDQERESALAFLDDYDNIHRNIHQIAANIHEKRDQLDALDQAIEPILVQLMVTVDKEVGLARLQIEDTRQAALRMLIGATLFGLLSAGIIAVSLHFSVTRNIISLIRVTNQFHNGNMSVRAQIDNSDELGELGRTFNEMAESVERLNAELLEQAIRDPLTGLYNRRYLDETLPRELARAARAGTPITLVMVDLDNLKEINDNYGHTIGDQVLRELGHLLISQSRIGDVACRFGGDEFIILMLNVNLAVGMQRAEDWRQDFERIIVTYNRQILQSTFSTGVVEWSPDETLESLFIRLDGALYMAKNTGRNRVAT